MSWGNTRSWIHSSFSIWEYDLSIYLYLYIYIYIYILIYRIYKKNKSGLQQIHKPTEDIVMDNHFTVIYLYTTVGLSLTSNSSTVFLNHQWVFPFARMEMTNSRADFITSSFMKYPTARYSQWIILWKLRNTGKLRLLNTSVINTEFPAPLLFKR